MAVPYPPVRDAHRRLRLFADPALAPHELIQTYATHALHAEEKLFVAGHGVSSIQLDRGALRVDDWPILSPSIASDGISWHQQTHDRFSSGHLVFDKGGTELHGHVFVGTAADSAELHHVLATTIQPVAYRTRITTQRFPDGTDPASVPPDRWSDGLSLEIGYEQSEGDLAPHPVVILNDQDISEMTSWTIDPTTQQTVLLLALDPDIACPLDDTLYVAGRVAFDQLVPEPTFSGWVSATCTDRSGTGTFIWTGSLVGEAPAHPAVRMLAAPAVQLQAADLIESSSLSIAELMTIVPDTSVTNQANGMIVQNMKWAFAQSSSQKAWLSEFFGEQPPALPTDRQDLVKKSLDWYQNHFGKAYLSSSFANYDGPNAPSVKLTDPQKLKLDAYLKTGMAKDPDFSIQQNGVFLQAFIQAKPRLQAYIDDGAQKWAEQLYKIITSPAQMILMVNRIWGAGGVPGTLTPANNFATLLSALQGTDGPLAGDYMHAVMSGALSHSAHQTTWTDKATVMEWLPDFLQALLTEIAQSGSVPDEDKLLAQQLRELQAQLGGSLTTVAEQLAEFVINANGASILEKTKNAESAFAKAFPRLGAIGRGLFFMAWCGGIYMAVKAFQNWDKLTPEDKAKAILSTAQLGLSALDVVPEMISGIKSMGMKGWNKFLEWRNGPVANEDVQAINEVVDELGEDWIKIGADETTPLFDAAEGAVKTEGTLWETIFEGAGKVVGVLGVVVSAAFAVLSTIDFVNDIKSGQPIGKTVVDGIMAAANIGMTVCLVLDLVVAGTIFAMAAAVFAVIGLVVAIIAMFVIKPANPLDEFMSDTVVPFVDALPQQTPPPAPSGIRPTLAFA